MNPDTATLVGLTGAALVPTGLVITHLAGYAWQSGRHRANRRHSTTPAPAADKPKRRASDELPARPVWDENGDLITRGQGVVDEDDNLGDSAIAKDLAERYPTEDTDTLTGLRLVTTDQPTGRHRPVDPHADTARIPRYTGPIPTQGGHR